jgi:hypothetical protein
MQATATKEHLNFRRSQTAAPVDDSFLVQQQGDLLARAYFQRPAPPISFAEALTDGALYSQTPILKSVLATTRRNVPLHSRQWYRHVRQSHRSYRNDCEVGHARILQFFNRRSVRMPT